MQNIYSCTFPNVGFMGAELNDDEFAPILAEVNEMENNFGDAKPMNDSLVGHIRHQYLMVKSHDLIEQISIEMAMRYQQVFQSCKLPPNTDLRMEGAWVNFQQKHEFNPLHNHSGDFSFVIYVKIPYLIEDEKKYTSTVPAQLQIPGSFIFHYTDALGQISPWTLPTDKTYEKRIIIFPARMMHVVHPFYSSDDFRVSVSGNLKVVPK